MEEMVTIVTEIKDLSPQELKALPTPSDATEKSPLDATTELSPKLSAQAYVKAYGAAEELHRADKAERATRSFPMSLWHELRVQAEITFNHLRPLAGNFAISDHEGISGCNYDFHPVPFRFPGVSTEEQLLSVVVSLHQTVKNTTATPADLTAVIKSPMESTARLHACYVPPGLAAPDALSTCEVAALTSTPIDTFTPIQDTTTSAPPPVTIQRVLDNMPATVTPPYRQKKDRLPVNPPLPPVELVPVPAQRVPNLEPPTFPVPPQRVLEILPPTMNRHSLRTSEAAVSNAMEYLQPDSAFYGTAIGIANDIVKTKQAKAPDKAHQWFRDKVRLGEYTSSNLHSALSAPYYLTQPLYLTDHLRNVAKIVKFRPPDPLSPSIRT